MSNSNKKITQLDIIRKIRKSWGNISPVEKVVPNKKSGKYSRARKKREIIEDEN